MVSECVAGNYTHNYVITQHAGWILASPVTTLAATMAVTQADIDALNRAIADGVRSVTVRGQTVIYNTTDSLIRARDDMQEQFNATQATATGTRPTRRTLLSYAGRGYSE